MKALTHIGSTRGISHNMLHATIECLDAEPSAAGKEELAVDTAQRCEHDGEVCPQALIGLPPIAHPPVPLPGPRPLGPSSLF